VLLIANRSEPDSLSEKALGRVAGLGDTDVHRLFNAALTIKDDRRIARPYVAEALPELNTRTWLVTPDGRMETTYRLRPGLTWHDGTPLSAEDFVFAWRVYATPEFGVASAPPVSVIEEVVAFDALTVLVRWRQPFPDAGTLDATEFPPLPRHILGEPLLRDQGTFASHPFWTTEYVGLGPYRLQRWEPGAFLEGLAFEGHAWGRPRIDRVLVRLISDPNAVLASLLSGEAHFAVRNAIQFQQGMILRRDWNPREGGTVLVIPSYWGRAEVQHRPDYVSPRAILDVPVRKALAHLIDRQALIDAVYEGEAIIADSMIPPTVDYFAQVDHVVAKYPLEPRRAEQLMSEAGWRKGTDGTYVSATDGRFSMEIKTNATQDLATQLSIVADGLRQAGFDVREATVPVAQARDGQVRGTFPSLYLGGGGIDETGTLPNFVSWTIPGPENRWVGLNRGGWSNQQYDRLLEAYSITLDRAERTRQIAQMARIFTEEVAAIPFFFYPSLVAHIAALKGPGPFVPPGLVVWNVHEWEWRA
jgi:peptide/nickel transport system substrate-binding protein